MMHRLLVSVLLTVAYFSFASAHIHLEVQRNLTADFGTFVLARNTAKNYKTKFPIPNLGGDDYTFLLTMKLNDGSLTPHILAAGYDGNADSKAKCEEAIKNAYYSKAATRPDNTAAAYVNAKEEFFKHANNAQMNCDYFASAEVVCDIKTQAETLGTYLVVAFRGYTNSPVVDPTPATIPWLSYEATEELINRRVEKMPPTTST